MIELNLQIDMIAQVAKALGDLLDDVDLIVNIITHADWKEHRGYGYLSDATGRIKSGYYAN